MTDLKVRLKNTIEKIGPGAFRDNNQSSPRAASFRWKHFDERR
jgi:hypothetical protein